MRQVHDIEDLVHFKYPGDAKLEHFRNSWDDIVDSLQDHIADQTLCSLLLKHLKQSKLMAGTVEHFHRVGVRSPDHSYEFLRGSIEKRLNLDKMESNRELRETTRNAAANKADGNANVGFKDTPPVPKLTKKQKK